MFDEQSLTAGCARSREAVVRLVPNLKYIKLNQRMLILLT